MNARILPFPPQRPTRTNPPNPQLIDLLFGNVDLFKLFRSLPTDSLSDGCDPGTTNRRKPRQQK